MPEPTDLAPLLSVLLSEADPLPKSIPGEGIVSESSLPFFPESGLARSTLCISEPWLGLPDSVVWAVEVALDDGLVVEPMTVEGPTIVLDIGTKSE